MIVEKAKWPERDGGSIRVVFISKELEGVFGIKRGLVPLLIMHMVTNYTGSSLGTTLLSHSPKGREAAANAIKG
jgi:hypothetical protein